MASKVHQLGSALNRYEHTVVIRDTAVIIGADRGVEGALCWIESVQHTALSGGCTCSVIDGGIGLVGGRQVNRSVSDVGRAE